MSQLTCWTARICLFTVGTCMLLSWKKRQKSTGMTSEVSDDRERMNYFFQQNKLVESRCIALHRQHPFYTPWSQVSHLRAWGWTSHKYRFSSHWYDITGNRTRPTNFGGAYSESLFDPYYRSDQNIYVFITWKRYSCVFASVCLCAACTAFGTSSWSLFDPILWSRVRPGYHVLFRFCAGTEFQGDGNMSPNIFPSLNILL